MANPQIKVTMQNEQVYDDLKKRATKENTSMSKLISRSVEIYLYNKNTVDAKLILPASKQMAETANTIEYLLDTEALSDKCKKELGYLINTLRKEADIIHGNIQNR